jgi:8-amino-7-oxononanoate synthase
MGTLSKAFGSYGGYVCAPQPVVDLLKTRARTLVYSTALPAASVAAAMAALEIVAAEPERVARPLALARQFTLLLGLPEAQSAIVPIVLGELKRTLAVSAALEEAGFLVGASRPPTVPPGTSRLRVTFSAAHGEGDVAALAAALRPHLEAGP